MRILLLELGLTWLELFLEAKGGSTGPFMLVFPVVRPEWRGRGWGCRMLGLKLSAFKHRNGVTLYYRT